MKNEIQDLEAVIKEADVWWTNVKQAISDFEKDSSSSTSSKTASIPASEKLLRYMEGKNRQKVSASWKILRLVCHLTSMLVRENPSSRTPVWPMSCFQTVLASLLGQPLSHLLLGDWPRCSPGC